MCARPPSGCRGENEGNWAGPLRGSGKSRSPLSGSWGQVPQTERSRAAGGTGEREVPGSLPKTMKHGGRSSTQSAHTRRQPHPRAIAQGHVVASAASQVCPRGSLWLCDKVTCVCFWSRARVESHGKGRATAQEAETALCRVRPACHGWKAIMGQVGPPSQRPGPIPPRAQRDGKPGPLFAPWGGGRMGPSRSQRVGFRW